MSTLKPMLDLLEEQQSLQSRLLQEAKRIDAMDFVSQNQALERRLAAIQTDIEAYRAAHKSLEQENRQLKEALVGQAYSRRSEAVSQALSRAGTRYDRFSEEYLRQLAAMEQRYGQQIVSIQRQLVGERSPQVQELEQSLQDCRAKLGRVIASQRELLEQQRRRTMEELTQEHQALERQDLTPEEVRRSASRDNMEFRIGSRIANILGVLLILIGVVAGLQYTYTYLLTSPLLRSAAAYLLGALFLVGGELLGKKRRTVFSLGITSGGIGILFASTAISYFVLQVLGMFAALGMCILISALAFLLSMRYNSQTIANFALIGGFLPVYAVSFGSPVILYGLMVYLVLLNFLAMLLSANRDWRSVKHISLFFNTVSSLFLVFGGDGGAVIELLYVTVNFSLYVFIAILYPMRKQQPLDTGSMLLVVANSLVNCAFVFGIIGARDLGDWMGLAALCLGVFYYMFSHYLSRRMEDSRLPGLFLVSSLVFAVLVVPLQFGAEWIALGWLFEAAILLVAGIFTGEKWYRRIGGVTYVLSLLSFVVFELWYMYDFAFLVKFSAVVLTSVFILAAGLYRNRETEAYLYTPQGRGMRWLKHYVMVLLYLYLLYLVRHVLYAVDYSYGRGHRWDIGVFSVLVTTAWAWALTRLKHLRDSITGVFSMVLFLGVALFIFGQNMVHYSYISAFSLLPAPVTFLILDACGVFAAVMVLRWFVEKGRLSPQLHPLILFSFLLLLLLQTLTVQLQLSLNSMILSLVLICAGLLYVLHGFRCRTAYTRRTGLGLAIVAVIKFFIIDLSFLGTGQKIISYFALGAVLIGISFIYQHFAQRVFQLSGIALDTARPAGGEASGDGGDRDNAED